MAKFIYFAMGKIKDQTIAPSRRMKFIYDGFKKLDMDMLFVGGTRQERNRMARSIIFSGEYKEVETGYIETSNAGMVLWEFILLVLLKWNGAYISVFIRDAYPFFKEYWRNRGFKLLAANILWLVSIIVYSSTCKIFYFPSEGLGNLFRMKNRRVLRPGIDHIVSGLTERSKTIFYAGGVTGQYDMDTFLVACEGLRSKYDIKVLVYCRSYSRENVKKWLSKDWIKVEHKTLEQLNFKPLCGIIPLKRNKHTEVAFAVKLLDYVKLGVPIVASDTTTIKDYILEKGIGVICKAENVKSYIEQIEMLLTNPKLHGKLSKNVEKLQEDPEIYWDSICERIMRDLRKGKI